MRSGGPGSGRAVACPRGAHRIRRCRRIRPPEPYKGKGIRYVGESVREPAKYYRNNVANTLTLLEAMQQVAGKQMRVVQTALHPDRSD